MAKAVTTFDTSLQNGLKIQPRGILTHSARLTTIQPVKRNREAQDTKRYRVFEQEQPGDGLADSGDVLVTVIFGHLETDNRDKIQNCTAIVNNLYIAAAHISSARNLYKAYLKAALPGANAIDQINGDLTTAEACMAFKNERKHTFAILENIAAFNNVLSLRGLAMSHLPLSYQRSQLQPNQQIAIVERGKMSTWNSGKGELFFRDRLFVILPAQGSSRQQGYPNQPGRRVSETRKQPIIVSDQYLARMVLDAVDEYENEAELVNRTDEQKDILLHQLKGQLRHFFRSQFIGICLSAHVRPGETFNILRDIV